MRIQLTFTAFLFNFSLSTATTRDITAELTNNNLNGDPNTFVTVGESQDCDFSSDQNSLQTAFNSGIGEVRLAAATYNGNFTIQSTNITIKGGYDNCADAALGISNNNQQIISGVTGANAPTFLISNNGPRTTVNIASIELTNGEGQALEPGGGITTLNADLELNLSNVNLTANTGVSGGGLAVIQGNTDVIINDSSVASNSASEGGGIYCEGTEASLVFQDTGDQSSGIYLNTATNGDGGGVLTTGGCQFTTYNGTASPSTDLRGIHNNSATGNGGGVAITSGATALLSGRQICFFSSCDNDSLNPVNINNNIANSNSSNSGSGGGVYSTGVDSYVALLNVLIDSNRAVKGGGIAVTDAATAFIDGADNSPDNSCWSPGSCVQITNNKAGTGGAIALDTQAEVRMFRTLIKGNRADTASAINTNGSGTTFIAKELLVVNNGDQGNGSYADNDLMLATDGSSISFKFSTIADNFINPNSTAYFLNSVSTITVESSIVNEPSDIDIYNEVAPINRSFKCVLLHKPLLISNQSQNLVADPGFIDRNNGDYHLNAQTSPAVDFCDDSNFSANIDSDFDLRPFDYPTVANENGAFDAGYDEVNDIIYIDGFE